MQRLRLSGRGGMVQGPQHREGSILSQQLSTIHTGFREETAVGGEPFAKLLEDHGLCRGTGGG